MLLYLQAAMYYFVYYINTRRLYRQPLRRLYYQPNKVLQKASDTQQLIDDINQRILHDKHFFQSSFHEKALRFSQIFIFCFHRDNFIKFLKFHYTSLCILRHKTFDIDDLSSMEDDPLCILCMSWLIDEKA